jgi:hypothetical protein
MKIEIPSIHEVKKYLAQWNEGEKKFSKMDSAINYLFMQYPKNDDINTIFLKCAVIDNIYHTNISQYRNIYDLAEHIYNKNVDKKLTECDATVVEDISEYNNLFSFATKFCSFHKPDQYPIYDHFVHDALKYFNKHNNKFVDEIKIKPYLYFKETIDNFIKHYGLDQGNYCYATYKSIDIYLWFIGKNLKDNNKHKLK